MTHKIISTIDLGILGFDPITAVYLLAMGMRKEKKSNITLFILFFTLISILVGAIISVVFGPAVLDFVINLIPADDSPFWAFFRFAIALIILVSVFWRLNKKTKKVVTKEEQKVPDSSIKYVATGLVFATATFTDPTYYAVILLSSETNSFILAILLISIWFLTSQFSAVLVYIANQFNRLDRLVIFIDTIKNKYKNINHIFYFIFIIIALLLIIDSGFYLLFDRYLF